jgi:alpha-glucosidase (family GH31 glycosyl hydrolase)
MPMVRNYYNATYRDAATGQRTQAQGSEPWNAQSDQLNLAYASLGDRLKLSRYIYTQMYLAHTQGGSVIKPLFFDFPKDDEVFSDSV